MKTVDEEANDANGYGYPLFKMEGKRQAFHEGFKQGVEFAQRFIDINEELPEKASFIIVKKSDRNSRNRKSM